MYEEVIVQVRDTDINGQSFEVGDVVYFYNHVTEQISVSSVLGTKRTNENGLELIVETPMDKKFVISSYNAVVIEKHYD